MDKLHDVEEYQLGGGGIFWEHDERTVGIY
jgi:hypothetical protein